MNSASRVELVGVAGCARSDSESRTRTSVSRGEERIDDVRADEPGAAGYEDRMPGTVTLDPAHFRPGVARPLFPVLVSGRRQARGVIDVILPVLDEAAGAARRARRVPTGLRAARGRQRLDATAPARWRARLGARVVCEPRRGFGAACFAGLRAAHERGRVLHGLRRVARPARAAAWWPTRCGRRRPTCASARGMPRRRGVAVARAARQPRARARAAPPHRRAADRPRPDARGAPRAAARARAAATGVRLAARDGAARRRRRLAGRRGAGHLSAAGRGPIEGVSGSITRDCRAVRDMGALLR